MCKTSTRSEAGIGGAARTNGYLGYQTPGDGELI